MKSGTDMDEGLVQDKEWNSVFTVEGADNTAIRAMGGDKKVE